VIHGLLARGIERIVIANRTLSRAETLHQIFGGRVDVVRSDEVGASLAGAALLVNTTTLGMQGQPGLAVDVTRLPGHAIVADLVYVPVLTPLLGAAKAHGLRTADGLGMLLHQAVRGFALWFGKTPEVTAELRMLVEADLGSSHTKRSR
jgi:shikimate dehydrogenase